MRKIVMMLFLSLLTTGTMLAQQEKTTAQGPVKRDPAVMQEKVLSNLKQELALTDEQTQKIREMISQRDAEIKADREAQKAELETQRQKRIERAEKAKARQTAYNAQMKEVLTQEQYIRYLELKEERRARLMEKRRERMDQRRDRRPLREPVKPET